jgi:sec-independent protein translocase protein TatB
MFDIASGELLLVALVALLVIGPKDLPRVLRVVGNWIGKARRVAGQFRSGFDEMVRQSELEELEKKWAAENARIMAEHPTTRDYDSEPPPAMTELPSATDAAEAAPAKPAKRTRKKAALK